MYTARFAALSVSLGSFFAATAFAQSIRVEFRDSSGVQILPVQTFASGQAIELGSVPDSVRLINIFSVGSGLANAGVVT
jgi:hypothetical protein